MGLGVGPCGGGFCLDMPFIVVALYHFFDFAQFEQQRPQLLAELKRLGIKGSLLIAPEGINGTLAGTREAMDAFLQFLKTDIVKGDFEHKESPCDEQPFGRAKVRLKKETISLGEPVSLGSRGKYVDASQWNALIADPETIVIDVRNDYEVHLGTFEGARNPATRTFKQMPDYARRELEGMQHKKIATFCTGGIRCEKFTAWLVEQGFEDVFHLRGGILKYLEEVPEAQSKWQGECYVFDERVAVGHGLTPSQTASMCSACGHPLTPEDRADARYVEGDRCGFCAK